MSRLPAFIELIKPKIALTVGFTVAAGYLAAVATTDAVFYWQHLLCTVAGVTVVAFGSAVLNQAWEHKTDAEMARTAGRPIPTGRVTQAEAMLVGMLLAPWGSGFLAGVVNPLCGALTALTCVLYAFAYTPLKRVSAWATFVGAIPGAMPPLLGASAIGLLPAAGWILFTLLFLWQFPHFIAIAWKYREQYEAAGMFMLPKDDPEGLKAGKLALGAAVALVLSAVALWPIDLPVSTVIAGVAGIAYASAAAGFAKERDMKTAGRTLGLSFLYVPVVYGTVLVEAAVAITATS